MDGYKNDEEFTTELRRVTLAGYDRALKAGSTKQIDMAMTSLLVDLARAQSLIIVGMSFRDEGRRDTLLEWTGEVLETMVADTEQQAREAVDSGKAGTFKPGSMH